MLAASTISFILTCGDVDFGSDGDDDANNDNSEEEIPVKGRHPFGGGGKANMLVVNRGHQDWGIKMMRL